jgi:hypothetical protein
VRTPVACLVALAFIACTESQEERALSTSAPSHSFFIALSEREDSDPVAWLLSVDSTGRAGRVYSPDGGGSLCNVASAGDTLRWTDGAFEFDGARIDDSTWTGTVARSRRPGFPRPPPAWPATVYRLTRLSDEDPAIGRVYSSIHVHQETGDLLGTEIVLLPVREEIWALVALAEGNASLPWIVRDLDRSSGSLSFSLATSYGTIPVAAEFRPDGLMASIGVSEPELLRDTTSVELELTGPPGNRGLLNPTWSPCR